MPETYTIPDLLSRIDTALKSATPGLTSAGNLTSSLLPAKKRDRFIRKMEAKTVVLPEARFMLMENVQEQIPRIGFGGTILGPTPAETSEFTDSDAVRPDDGLHTMEAIKAAGLVSLTDEELETNIMKEGFEAFLLDLIAERVGLDVEFWGLQGDTDSANSLLALNDGWVKLAGLRTKEDAAASASGDFTTLNPAEEPYILELGQEGVPITPSTLVADVSATQKFHDDGLGNIVEDDSSGITGTVNYYTGTVRLFGLANATQYDWSYTVNTFDADGTAFPIDMFNLTISCLGDVPEFDNRREWRFYVPFWVRDMYHDYIINRETGAGDAAILSDGTLVYKNVPIVNAPKMAQNRCLLTHPSNTNWGVYKNINIERGRRHLALKTDFISTIRCDFDYERRDIAVAVDIS